MTSPFHSLPAPSPLGVRAGAVASYPRRVAAPFSVRLAVACGDGKHLHATAPTHGGGS